MKEDLGKEPHPIGENNIAYTNSAGRRARGVVVLDENGNLARSMQTIFGQTETAELTPVVQMQFPYNINTELVNIRDNFGTASVVSNLANLSTGAGANQSSNILTKTPVKYNPGQDISEYFTAIFPIGKEGSFQWAGIGDLGDGYFVGNNGVDFVFNRRYGGKPEVRRLSITTPSTTAENITITLDGDTKTDVAVTNSNDVTITANEIANTDYSNIGRGWESHSMGGSVFFTSYGDSAKSGTYSLSSATTAIGAFTQSLVGVTATNNIVKQTDWSHDKLSPIIDGTPDINNPSGITLDLTKGNVFRIRFGWLGFDGCTLEIKNPHTLKWILVHVISYSNANILTSLVNPTLPLCFITENTTNTTDMIMKIGSAAAFVGGRDKLPGLPHSTSVSRTGIGTDETPIFTIHAHDIYKGNINRVKIKPIIWTVSADGNKPSIARIRKNAILTGASFSALNSETSTIRIDVSATSVSNGIVVDVKGVPKSGKIEFDLEKAGITLVAPEFLTLTLEASSTTVDAVVSGNWQELF